MYKLAGEKVGGIRGGKTANFLSALKRGETGTNAAR